MMLNVAEHAMEVERKWLRPASWFGPSVLASILLGELAYSAMSAISMPSSATAVGPKQVGVALYGTYWIGVELASLLLMAGLVGAFHLGRRALARRGTTHVADTDAARLDTSSNFVHAGARRTNHAA
jgi:NADH-quinone oxidoreductase subunit J